MSHTLLKIGEGYKCSVCTQTWKSKPRSECPGVIVYEWGKQPEHLIFHRDLFPKGLKLADGQQHSAVMGSNHYRLYDINEAVPHGLNIDFGNSKYAFLDTDDGFDIYRVCGTKVSVRYANTYIEVWCNNARTWRHNLGLYDFKRIVKQIADLFVDVVLPSAKKSEAEDAAEMIARALTSRFKTHWQRIITQIVPKDVEVLARKMWSSALERDVGLLFIWVIFIAMIVLLTVDFAEGQWLIDRRKDDAKLCLVYYTADGTTSGRYGDCR